jgi:hypothetical protein
MKEIIIIWITLAVFSNNLIAQSPSFDWLVNFGNSLNDEGNSIAVDNNGNVYVCGSINGIVDLDPSTDEYNITSNVGSNDFFIAKYDSSGSIIWGFRRGSSYHDRAIKIILTNMNDLVVVGNFGGSFDFDPSADGNTSLDAGTNNDGFVAKYDTAGNFIWAFNIGNQTFSNVNGVDVDPNDNVYVIGDFSGTVDFNPGTGTVNLTSANGADFVAKYDSAGNYIWAFKIESSLSIVTAAISVDPLSNVHISGQLYGTADFNPTAAVSNLTSTGGGDIFLAKYSAASTLVWAYDVGSSGDDIGFDINAKTLGRVYLTGIIDGVIDFDVSAGSYPVFTSGGLNGFLASYDVNANIQWAFGLGQPGGGSIATATSTDASGDTYLVGLFNGAVDFDPSSNIDTISAPLTSESGFIAKYNSAGAYQFAHKLETASHTYLLDMAVDLDNSIFVSGRFAGTCDFDPSGLNNTNTVSNGFEDGFIAKYSSNATGINEINFDEKYRIYPNPANSYLLIESPFRNNHIAIFSSTGALVRKVITDSFVSEISIEDLSTGVYLIKMETASSSVVKKIIKY